MRARAISTTIPAPKARLKLTKAFRAIYRRGRWVHGQAVSIGILANQRDDVRIGLRTRRGMKGATVRNRLKRQTRAIVFHDALRLRPGRDLVIVLHPPVYPVSSQILKQELVHLCQRIGAMA